MQPTSLAANEASKPKRHTNQMKILQALERLPNKEGIADTIAVYCSLDKIEVSRRMSEMEREGKVFNTGRTGITAKGCKAILWRLVKEPQENTNQTTLF